MKNESKYEKIIGLPHHVSERHPRLGKDSYAAQFSPFAALSGYEQIISETVRTTNERPQLDDDAKLRLSNKLKVVMDHIDEKPLITLSYFVPDKRKAGGECVTLDGVIKKLDVYERIIFMTDGRRIPADDLYDISGDIINRFIQDDI